MQNKMLLLEFYILSFILFIAFFIKIDGTHLFNIQVKTKGKAYILLTGQQLYDQAVNHKNKGNLDSSIVFIKKYLYLFNNDPYNTINGINLLSSNFLDKGFPDSAKYYIDKARGLLYCDTNNLKLRIQTEKLYGKYFFNIAHYESSLVKYNHVLNLCSKFGSNITENISEIYKSIGKNHLMLKDTSKATYNFKLSISFLPKKTIADSVNLANIMCNIGSEYSEVGFYERAINIYYDALKLIQNIDTDLHELILYNIAITYYRMGEIETAFNIHKDLLNNEIFLLEKKIESIDDYYDNFGYYYLISGKYKEAEIFLKKALKIRLELSLNNSDLFYSYSYLGTTYFYLSDYQLSLEYYLNALRIANRNPERFSAIDKVYCNVLLGNVYKELGNAKECINSYSSCLFLLKISKKTYIDYEIICYINLGLIYMEISQEQEAKRMLDLAIQRLPSLKNEMPLILSQIYFNLGELYLKFGNYYNARKFYLEALNHILIYFGSKHPLAALTNIKMGYLYEKNNDIDSALYYYQQAIISSFSNINEVKLLKNPDSNELPVDFTLFSALKNKARLLYIKHKNIYIEDSILTSLNTYLLAIDLFECIKLGFSTQESKLQLSENHQDLFREALTVTFELFNLSKKREYMDIAFTIAEKNKASILRQSLNESNAKYYAGIPDSLISKEKELVNRLDFFYNLYNHQLSSTMLSNDLAGNYYRSMIFDLRQQYDFLIDYFEVQFPQYYELKYDRSTIDLIEVQNQLDQESLLIEYVDLEDNFLLFAISKDTVMLEMIKTDSTLKKSIEDFRTGISKIDYELYTKNAYELYKALIEPIITHIEKQKLIIVPDGSLSYIPFEALLTEPAPNKKPDYHSLAYFINRYQVNYEYSTTLLFKNSRYKSPNTNTKFYGFAPITYH